MLAAVDARPLGVQVVPRLATRWRRAGVEGGGQLPVHRVRRSQRDSGGRGRVPAAAETKPKSKLRRRLTAGEFQAVAPPAPGREVLLARGAGGVQEAPARLVVRAFS